MNPIKSRITILGEGSIHSVRTTLRMEAMFYVERVR